MSAKNGSITEQVDSRLDDLFGDDDTPQENDQEMESASEGVLSPEPETTDPGLDDRLEDFFGKERKVKNDSANTPGFTAEDIENSAIKDLKSVILSLEWEITDQVMQKLGEEIKKLEEKSKGDKIVVAFLQLLGSLGKYIRKKRAEAHPESITLLNSVYESLEEAMLSKTLSEADKKKMLVARVNQYKQLKEEIVVAKSATPARAEPSAPSEPTHPRTESPDSADFSEEMSEDDSEADAGGDALLMDTASSSRLAREILKALESIRATIQKESSALRAEIQQLKKD